MALEALKAYAAEQNQATQAEIDKLLKNDAQKRPTSDEKGKSNIKPLVSKENVAEGLLERLAAAYKKQQENEYGSRQEPLSRSPYNHLLIYKASYSFPSQFRIDAIWTPSTLVTSTSSK